MSKTELTKEIERALFARTSKTIGAYGALEVTIGHISGVEGYDRCDYVEFDTIGEKVELLEAFAKSASRDATKYYLYPVSSLK
ncbi:hypothetical protein [Ligilactobacillus equi]|uniref:Uncharacterized protein n=1 Tax=Ligilactobacillus equi DPC 6820 TaxID=1392007 RepID=V7HXK3_9LACO|nr:hypothetical protein [Ligilactobacillus equi]ETA73771.1 hypothetical protein LEQ_0074c [Ligilactobacillus equi DPC 6820]